MTVNPLAYRPLPAHGDQQRALIVWTPSDPAQNPLASYAQQQVLLAHCGAHGITTLWLDMWNTLGAPNWSNEKRDMLRTFLAAAHGSGLSVHALAGDPGYALAPRWVLTNVVAPLASYNAQCEKASQRFQGLFLDIEYWNATDPNPALHLPALYSLVEQSRWTLQLPVGGLAAHWLLDGSTEGYYTVRGLVGQQGVHLAHIYDHLLVTAYRNHAQPVDGVPGQLERFAPWMAAPQLEGCGPLFLGSQCEADAAGITYAGMTKVQMESQLLEVSSAHSTSLRFAGHGLHGYVGHLAMP